MAASTFKVDNAAVDSFIATEVGPTSQYAHSIGRKTVAIAKRLVGVESGTLRGRISYSVNRRGAGWEVVTVADTHYALAHHEGTEPHVITPKTARVLRFRQQGRVVYAQKVFHPGTRANPFLVRAMREAVR